MKILAFLFMLITSPLMACEDDIRTAPDGPIMIVCDLGGPLFAADIDRAYWALAPRVAIQGVCASACTTYLSLPNACVMPGAQFGFHWASAGWRGTEDYAERLPLRLRIWFLHRARTLGPDWVGWMSGSQILALGAARPC